MVADLANHSFHQAITCLHRGKRKRGPSERWIFEWMYIFGQDRRRYRLHFDCAVCEMEVIFQP
jgi:hypothetical protein